MRVRFPLIAATMWNYYILLRRKMKDNYLARHLETSTVFSGFSIIIRNDLIAAIGDMVRYDIAFLSGGVALIVWFTTSGMCVKNSTIIHVARASNSQRDCDTWSLLLLAASVRSFEHMPLGISDRIKIREISAFVAA